MAHAQSYDRLYIYGVLMNSLFPSQPVTISPLTGVTIFRYFWNECAGSAEDLSSDRPRCALFTPRMKNGQVFTQQLTSCGAFGWVADESGYR